MSTAVKPKPAGRSGPSWLHAPQRVWLRRAVFQVHLWAGLLLTLYAVVIGVSGSALVFRPELERALHPALRQVHGPEPGQGPRLPLQKLVDAARQSHPGWVVGAVEDFSRPDTPTSVLLYPASGERGSNYRLVSVNPWTGTVLADSMRFGGVLGWTANLHYYLLTGETGLKASGWFALGLLVLCLTGVVVWWPGVSRAAGSLVYRRRTSWKRLNWDLHAVTGFWTAGWLALLCVTGLYFAFPVPVETIVLRVFGSSLAEARTHDAFQPKPPSVGFGPVLSVDAAAGRARELLPASAPPNYLSLPAKPGDPYYVTGYFQGAPPYSQMVNLALDPHTGAVLSRSDTHGQPLGQRLIQLFFALHFGSFAGEGVPGVLVKALWVVLGLTPALLAVTGVLMFWNRKLWPMVKRRRAPAA